DLFLDWHLRIAGALAWLLAAILALMAVSRLEAAFDADTLVFFVVIAPAAAIYFLYHPVLEVLMRGRTPGKRYAGVRIVSLADGSTPSIGQLLIRNVFRIVDSLPIFYAFGLLVSMFTKNAVRIGDIAAGTVLVYEQRERANTLETLASAGTSRLG